MDHFSLLERSCAVFEFFREIWVARKIQWFEEKLCSTYFFLICISLFCRFLELLFETFVFKRASYHCQTNIRQICCLTNDPKTFEINLRKFAQKKLLNYYLQLFNPMKMLRIVIWHNILRKRPN